MPAIMPAKLTAISQASAKDPKQAILDALGDAVDGVEVFGSYLLVATYIEPEKSSGGIIIPDKSKMEGLWQGCMGLVLKKGPAAFVDDGVHKFYGQDVAVGDWIVFRFSDAWEQHLNGVSVRFVADVNVKGKTGDPTRITSRPRVPGS